MILVGVEIRENNLYSLSREPEPKDFSQPSVIAEDQAISWIDT